VVIQIQSERADSDTQRKRLKTAQGKLLADQKYSYTGLPTYLCNDAIAGTIAENLFGLGENHPKVF
jgi:predicted NBD/HSP70 family sugar kinase